MIASGAKEQSAEARYALEDGPIGRTHVAALADRLVALAP